MTNTEFAKQIRILMKALKIIIIILSFCWLLWLVTEPGPAMIEEVSWDEQKRLEKITLRLGVLPTEPVWRDEDGVWWFERKGKVYRIRKRD